MAARLSTTIGVAVLAMPIGVLIDKQGIKVHPADIVRRRLSMVLERTSTYPLVPGGGYVEVDQHPVGPPIHPEIT